MGGWGWYEGPKGTYLKAFVWRSTSGTTLPSRVRGREMRVVRLRGSWSALLWITCSKLIEQSRAEKNPYKRIHTTPSSNFDLDTTFAQQHTSALHSRRSSFFNFNFCKYSGGIRLWLQLSKSYSDELYIGVVSLRIGSCADDSLFSLPTPTDCYSGHGQIFIPGTGRHWRQWSYNLFR